MTLIEEIFAIPPGDWTPSQLEIIKAFVRSHPMLKTTERVSPSSQPPYWSLLPHSTSDEDCAIARYFRDNPGKSCVHMTCICRRCNPVF